MKNNEKMIRWLLDAIDTEITKPDGEADMALVEECTALLGELNGTACTLSERELEKRCREITCGKAVGSKSVKKRVRMVAAVAACLAAFVVISGCGYLPSLNVIMQTLFASGVGKDVEVHEVTYTYEGNAVQYNNISTLLKEEKLDVMLPVTLPPDTYITNILHYDNRNLIIVIFNDPDISFQIFTNTELEDFAIITDCDVITDGERSIYIRKTSNEVYIAYITKQDNVYCIQHSSLELVLEILESIR